MHSFWRKLLEMSENGQIYLVEVDSFPPPPQDNKSVELLDVQNFFNNIDSNNKNK